MAKNLLENFNWKPEIEAKAERLKEFLSDQKILLGISGNYLGKNYDSRKLKRAKLAELFGMEAGQLSGLMDTYQEQKTDNSFLLSYPTFSGYCFEQLFEKSCNFLYEHIAENRREAIDSLLHEQELFYELSRARAHTQAILAGKGTYEKQSKHAEDALERAKITARLVGYEEEVIEGFENAARQKEIPFVLSSLRQSISEKLENLNQLKEEMVRVAENESQAIAPPRRQTWHQPQP